MAEPVQNKTENISDKDKKVKLLIEIADNVRKRAEEEARLIISDANKRAAAIVQSRHTESATNNISAERKKTGREIDRSGICQPEVFRIILDRERARSDRNGHELSLVMFDIESDQDEKTLSALIKALKNRSRAIDRYGWFDEEHIAVLLPNTKYRGSFKLAHDICEMMVENKVQPLAYKTYTYPTKWLTDRINLRRKPGGHHREQTHIEGANPLFAIKIPAWKRGLDIVGSITAFVLASPFFILVPVIIKIVSPGPVCFRQERVGYGGRIFTFLKFRTMRVNIDRSNHEEYLSDLIKSDKPMTKMDKMNDPRIIPMGKLMRKTCIDELPQLINVLRGEMSLVGPRPCLPNEADEYLKWHKYRFDIKPGMTGLWQVSGKNRLSFKQMIRLDIQYAKKLSLLRDIKILIRTIPSVASMVIERFAIDAFFNKVEKKRIPEEQFKEFIKRYYSDIYNIDRLEFIDDKLKDKKVDLMELIVLLSKINRLSPSYNVAKRYFGISRLIDFEKKSQLGSSPRS